MSDPGAGLQGYGHPIRDLWPLDPDIVYLNHGGFGVCPREVMAAADAWRARIERNPNRFMAREYPAELRKAAAVLAAFIGAAPDDVVFVENATAGCNAVLRSLAFAPGDEILIANVTYGAIAKAAEFAAGRSGATVVVAEIPAPLPDAAAAVTAFTAKLTPRTRLVIVDHIVSPTGVVLPTAEIAAAARAAGARVLIDGAHAPGHIPLDVAASGADWYVGNCHKWLFAPRACGFLWASGAAREGVHPLAISHGFGKGFTAEFDWTGTLDPSGVLAVPAGIAFHARLGGAALMRRNAALAREAVTLIAQGLGTPAGAPATMFASLATVRLPETFGRGETDAAGLRRRLADDHRIEAIVVALGGSLWLRIAAQAYNESADYERVLAALLALR